MATELGTPPVVLLKVLVLPNGRIGDVTVEGTCGSSEIDELARTFVASRWRFLPALEKGKLVADWISVEVAFARAS
jgi:TonB family protein